MITGKPKTRSLLRRVVQVAAQHTEADAVTSISSSRRPLTEALTKAVNRRVPNDPRGRTFADLIAEALVRRALAGNVKAARAITNWLERSVPPWRDPKGKRNHIPTEIKVIWPPERAETA
jgi:hypothetical protein